MTTNPSDLPSSHPQDDSEASWTHVKSKSKSKSRRRQLHSPISPKQIHTPSPQPRADTDLRSVKNIAAEYHTLRSQWSDSQCCSALRDIVAAGAPSLRTVSRAVCLGIGSFDPLDGSWEAKRKTYLQLISFLFVVDELEKCFGSKIPCIFQEPIFTAHDRIFLTDMGHQVVESPVACDAVDAETFVYGVHLYRPIYAMALKETAPAIFVGTGWDVWDQVDLSDGPSTDLRYLQEVEDSYKKFAFPQDTSTTAFSSTAIYFRPSSE